MFAQSSDLPFNNFLQHPHQRPFIEYAFRLLSQLLLLQTELSFPSGKSLLRRCEDMLSGFEPLVHVRPSDPTVCVRHAVVRNSRRIRVWLASGIVKLLN